MHAVKQAEQKKKKESDVEWFTRKFYDLLTELMERQKKHLDEEKRRLKIRNKTTIQPGSCIADDIGLFMNVFFKLYPKADKYLKKELAPRIPPVGTPCTGKISDEIREFMRQYNVDAPWFASTIINYLQNWNLWKSASGYDVLSRGSGKAPKGTRPIVVDAPLVAVQSPNLLSAEEEAFEMCFPMMWDTSGDIRQQIRIFTTIFLDAFVPGMNRYLQKLDEFGIQQIKERTRKSAPHERMVWLVRYLVEGVSIAQLLEQFAEDHPDRQIEDAQTIRKAIKKLAKRLDIDLPEELN